MTAGERIAAFIGMFMGAIMIICIVAVVPAPVGTTCEEKAVRVWAIQQCLRWQPACKMEPGPELFEEYHRFKMDVRENCPEQSVSGFLLKNDNDNEVTSNERTNK